MLVENYLFHTFIAYHVSFLSTQISPSLYSLKKNQYHRELLNMRQTMLKQKQYYYLQQMGIPVWIERKLGMQVPVAQTVHPENSDPWQALQQQVATCTACELHCTRTQTVFGVGNTNANLLIIGEAPGFYEDQQGEPFVGRAGQLLDNMLRAIKLDRSQVYIANILKCRPPNNRDPKPEEVALCTDFLIKQIELMQPKLILAVGRIAAHFLLNTDQPLGKLRQQDFLYQNIPLRVTYHPAYLLRNPRDKAKAWLDLQAVVAKLQRFPP